MSERSGNADPPSPAKSRYLAGSAGAIPVPHALAGIPEDPADLLSCAVFHDPPAAGAWNMAVDAALLESAVSQGCCALRWYSWQEPTLSLGYFQKFSPEENSALAPLPVVRRLSGGGAIVHDRELTYSCVLPASHPLSRTPHDFYVALHQVLVAELQAAGFPVQMRGTLDAEKNSEFLCFGRGDRWDILLDGYKVLGSAQRRRKGAVLQHGSLVLARSVHAPQFPGLADLRPARVMPGEAHWITSLSAAMAPLLGIPQFPSRLPEAVVAQARLLCEPTGGRHAAFPELPASHRSSGSRSYRH